MMQVSSHEEYLGNRNLLKQALAICDKSSISNRIPYAHITSAHLGSSRCWEWRAPQPLIKWLMKLSRQASLLQDPQTAAAAAGAGAMLCFRTTARVAIVLLVGSARSSGGWAFSGIKPLALSWTKLSSQNTQNQQRTSVQNTQGIP